MLFSRARRPARYAPAAKMSKPQPWGGAIPAVQSRYIRAVNRSDMREFPVMAAQIYQPPAIVNTPVEVAQVGIGMADRIYQPATEKPRTFGQKLQSWFKMGVFA